MSQPHLILASTSPRRSELLALLGLRFDVIPPTANEAALANESPKEHVCRLALDKARSVARHHRSSLVLGSDTVIELDSQILGKPLDIDDAEQMLIRLRGQCHQVHTGIALVRLAPHTEETSFETVRVWIKNFSDSVLKAYLQTQDSLGKAGAYSIQGEGAPLIEKIEGDYPAVVGLPLWQTAKLLVRCGIIPPKSVEEVYRLKPYANWKDFS